MKLVILAGGMGSRFGGLKQIEPVGPNGEFIIDYSIKDAINNGFDEIVFIINKKNYAAFEETIGKRIKKHVKYSYAFQDINDLPFDLKAPIGRTKPWGTTHALLSAKEKSGDEFVVINADDFYGNEAFKDAVMFFKNRKDNEFAIIGYECQNTLSNEDYVKRGILNIDQNNYLVNMTESKINNDLVAIPLDGSSEFKVDKNSLVSMNMMCFTKDVFLPFEREFNDYIVKNIEKENAEHIMSFAIDSGIKKNDFKIKIIPTKAKWYGITYKEDLPVLKKAIRTMIDAGIYEEKLWK